jgi:hypothetical protein
VLHQFDARSWRIASASAAPSSRGSTTSTLGKGFSGSNASAPARSLICLNSARPCAGVFTRTATTSGRARSSPARRSASASPIAPCRNRPTSRDCCTEPDRRSRLARPRPRPIGSASATAITPIVISVANGRRATRPRLETSE